MSTEKEKWIDDIFQSIQGSERAKPNPKLFSKVKNQFDHSTTQIVPLYQWKHVAIASVFIILFNTVALVSFIQKKQIEHHTIATAKTCNLPLISSYQIYE